MVHIGDKLCFLTFGLDEPAKPDLIVAVPLSMTIGWLSSKEPLPPPAAAAAVALPIVSIVLITRFAGNKQEYCIVHTRMDIRTGT